MGLWQKLEDAWFGFLDWSEAHGIPFYKIADFFENRHVSSLAVFLAIIVLIVAGVAGYFVFFANAQVIVQVSSEGSPVAGENVILSFGDQSPSAQTDSDGKAIFSVPYNSQVTASLDSTTFEATEVSQTISESGQTITLSASAVSAFYSKRFQFVSDASSALFDKALTATFTCSQNAEYSKTQTISGGEIILSDIPKDCGTVYVSAQGYSVATSSFAASDETAQVQLGEAGGTGKVLAFVKDEAGNSLSGIYLALKNASGVKLKAMNSSGTGSAEFASLPAGLYIVEAVDNEGTWLADPSQPIQVSDGNTVSVDINMRRAPTGKIVLKIADSESSARVEGAEVVLSKNGSPYGAAKYSDSAGSVEFKVAQEGPFSLSVDHPDYWKESVSSISPSASITTIALSAYDPLNGNVLSVHVVDEQNSPVENAFVRLKKSDGTVVGADIATGADGSAEFERVEPGTYSAEISKQNMESKTSGFFEVLARQANSTTIQISIGFGNVSITVKDEQGNPVAGAQLDAIDLYSGKYSGNKIVQGASTGSGGQKTFAVRTDHTVYVRASADGFLAGHSIAVNPVKDNSTPVEITLSKDVSKFELVPRGMELQGQSVESISSSENPSVSSGQIYTAKFLLKIPKNADFKSAEAFIRTDSKAGEAENKLVEQDYWFIQQVKSAAVTTQMGTQYSPPIGLSEDSEHFVESGGKWADLVFGSVEPGTYEIEATIEVRDSAVRGSVLELRYRASTSNNLRNPLDNVLGQSNTTATKQWLYADTKVQLYTVGPSTLCSNNYCGVTTITDLGSNIDTSIVSDYPASVSGNYRLNFLIAYTGSTSIAGAQLKVSNAENGLEIGNYNVKGMQGTANASEFALDVGSLEKGSTVSGTIDFTAQKEGISQLSLELIAGSEIAFSRTINVSVAPSQQLNIALVPKTIVPYIDNALTVIVLDAESGSALSNASISFSLDDSPLGSVQTKSNGSASFMLSAPSNGSTLKVEAKKENYQTAILSQTISEQILSFKPSEILQTLTVNGASEKEQSLTIFNETPIALSLRAVSSSDLKGIAQLSIDRNIGGEQIDSNKGLETVLYISLTDKGKALEKSTTIEGSIDFEVYNNSFGTWVAKVPLKISIGFGGEVDNESCLNVEPSEWKIVSGGDAVASVLSVQNNCKVDGEEISLSNLQAKLVWANESQIGTIEASSDFSTTKATLENSYATIASSIAAGSEGTVSLNFKPSSIASGTSAPTLYFKAINKTSEGDQEIIQKIKTNLSVNNLASCVNIQAEKLSIETTPINTGYNYANTRNYNQYIVPSNPWSYSNLPGAYDTYNYNAAAASAVGWPSASAKFTIENNCASDVDISFQNDNGLNVSTSSPFTLKSTASQSVKVEAGNKIGIFALSINAKVSGSTTESKEIKSLSIQVQSASQVNNDCISISSQSIRFNDFFGKPNKVSIYNDCYDLGVQLTGQATLNQYNSQFGTTGPSMGGQLVPMGNYLTSGGKGGGQRQVFDYSIPNDQSYRSQPGLQANTPFQQFGNLRYLFQGGMFNASTPAQLTATYTTASGQTLPATFNITLSDNWNFAQMGNPLVQGNPTLTDFQQCANVDGIKIRADDSWFAEHSSDKNPKASTGTDTFTVIRTGAQYCASSDPLSNLSPASVPLGTGRLNFEINSANKQQITVTITRNPSDSSYYQVYNSPLQASLTRTQVSGTKPVSIPTDIIVCNGKDCAGSGGQQNAILCGSGDGSKKGEGAIPKTFLTWDKALFYNDSKCNQSDVKYCDGTQFSLEFASKAKAVKEVVNRFTGDEGFLPEESTKKVEDFRNANNLYRFVFQQVKVKNNKKDAGDEWFVYFLGSEGILNKGPSDAMKKDPEIDSKTKSISDIKTTDIPANAGPIVETTWQILSRIESQFPEEKKQHHRRIQKVGRFGQGKERNCID
ncbi:MAG: carboxypeptidase-like regulatory domain-containing protein [Candidatus Diapherotrites archaeon]